jgi:hypothetical protein
MKKSLILAAVAALSLSAGAAFAQDGPAGPAKDYQATKALQWLSQRRGVGVDAGSSDITPTHAGTIHITPVPVGVPGGGNG